MSFFLEGLRSSHGFIGSNSSLNESVHDDIPISTDQQSIVNDEKILSLAYHNYSAKSLSQNYSAAFNFKTQKYSPFCDKSFHCQSNLDRINSSSMDTNSLNSKRQELSLKQNSSNSKKQHRYRVTIVHSDEPLDVPSNKDVAATEVGFSISFQI